jgi:hypothetical protein
MGALRRRHGRADDAAPEATQRAVSRVVPTLRQTAGTVASAGAAVLTSAAGAVASAGATAGAALASAGAAAGAAAATAGAAAGNAAASAAAVAGRVVVSGLGAVNTVVGPERLVGAAMLYHGAGMINRAAYHDEQINDLLAATLFAGGGMLMIARTLIGAEEERARQMRDRPQAAAHAMAPARVAPGAFAALAAPVPRPPEILEAIGEAMNMLMGAHDDIDLRDLPIQDGVRVGDHFLDYAARTTADPRVDRAIESAGLDPQRMVTNLLELVRAQPPVLSRRLASAAGRH